MIDFRQFNGVSIRLRSRERRNLYADGSLLYTNKFQSASALVSGGIVIPFEPLWAQYRFNPPPLS